MINIKIVEDPIRSEYTIDITGHAGYDEPGKDIVCAAVSTIFYMMLNYLDEKGSSYMDLIRENKSVLDVKSCNHPEFFLLDIAKTGFTMIENEYPDHVKVSYKKFTPSLG